MKQEKDVNLLIEDALEVRRGSLSIESNMNNTEQWDSLGHLSILSSLDRLFDGRVASISNIAQADSVGKIVDILSQNKLIE